MILTLALVLTAAALGSQGTRIQRQEPRSFHTGSLERPSQPSPNGFQQHNGEMIRELYNNMFRSFNHMTDFNTDNNAFFSRFLGNRNPWWKGPNVCVSEEMSVEENENPFFGSLTSHMCNTGPEMHSCVVKIGTGDQINVTTVTYRCCHGFERVTGEVGCTKELDLKPLGMAIRELNLTDFAEILDQLEGEQMRGKNFTIFVPTNEAMQAGQEFPTVVSGGTSQEDYIRSVVEAHMVDGWQSAESLSNEQVLDSVGGTPLRVNAYFTGAKPMVNCATIKSMDNKATNGYFHVVDKVLFPVEMTLAEILKMDNSLSQFASLLSAEEKTALEDATKQFTLFAFTNEAFDALSEDMRKSITEDGSCFKDLTKHHTLDFTLCSSAIRGENYVNNVMSTKLNLTKIEEVLHVDGAVVKTADRMAKNGVIHVIDKVLLDEKMLPPVEVAKRHGGEKMATEMQSFESIQNKIKETDEITVFVPPSALLEEYLSDKSPDEREKAMQAHLFEGKNTIEARREVKNLKNFAGIELELQVVPLHSFFGVRVMAQLQCARIVRANVPSCNGVVHYIDKPIVPASGSIFDVVQSNPNYSYFAGLLELAELADTLKSSDFTGTILAPTNAVFEAYGKSKIDGLSSEKLKEFVGGHILKHAHCCCGLGGSYLYRERHTTLAGHHLFSFNVGFSKHIGDDATITKCDQIGTNGIVHQIDAVLAVPERRSSMRWWRRDW